MKSPSLERFYEKINRAILLARSYTEISELPFIIKACRLKPVTLINGAEKYKLKLFTHWFDEFNNSLKIKNKKLSIIYNDLSVKPICTDMYYGLSISKVAKMSKLMHLIIGLDEDTLDNYLMITFLGIDNYLRTYLFMYDEWVYVSPLMIGISRLQDIVKFMDITYFRELSYKKNSAPCVSATEWISYVLPPKQFLDRLKKRHDVDLTSIFYEE